jgi:hypothetical protein
VHRARNRDEGSCREMFPGGLADGLAFQITNSPFASCRVDSTQARELTWMGIIEKGDSEVQVISSLKGGVGGLLHCLYRREQRDDRGVKRTKRLTAADGAKGGPRGS